MDDHQFNELITLSGGKNIAASLPGWVKISPEFVAEAEPDIIIIPVIKQILSNVSNSFLLDLLVSFISLLFVSSIIFEPGNSFFKSIF